MLCYKKYFKHICRLAVFSVLFSFQGCTKSKNINYAEILNKELDIPHPSDRISFSTTLIHAPTIKYKINGVELFMVVDTGANRHALLNSKPVQNLVKKDLSSNEAYSLAKKSKYYAIYFYFDEEPSFPYILDPNGIFSTGMKKNNFDGLLGLPYLQKNRNVVFDYINNTMSFNEEPICDNSLPMYRNKDELWFTPIECNGVKTNALIDTGCNLLFINKNKKRIIGEDKYANVKLGNVEINDLFLGSDKDVTSNEKAKNGNYKNENIIGYSVFKDHVIQLDFENNVFRIK